jgi:mannitol-1-phosphate/altronate dehydrogenase
VGGPVGRAALALAGWARYLAVTPVAEQAHDAAGEVARRHAERALDAPTEFLRLDAVFPASVATHPRFRDAFAAAYEAISDLGPLGAIDAMTAR